MTISAVYEHNDGYKWEERYADKATFARRVRNIRNAKFLHAADTVAGIAIYPSNIGAYLRTR